MNGKIIKIMGCSGAGKTTAVRSVLDMAKDAEAYKDQRGKDEYYRTLHSGVVAPVYVLGNYRGSNCGGMDTVGSADLAMSLVHETESKGHVIHEGLLQSTYYGKMGIDSQRYGDRYIYALLDTPIELCLERVVLRREANNSRNKFDPQLTRDKHSSCQRAWEKARDHGHVCVTLDHKQAIYPQLISLILK